MGLEEIDGIAKVIRFEIIRGTRAQLDEDARLYSKFENAQSALEGLARKIRDDGFMPDFIVAWIDENRHWNGSEIVGTALAEYFRASLLRIDILEEGERRKIKKLPEIPNDAKNILVVDDAGFTGQTMLMFKNALHKLNPGLLVRTAVICCQIPVPPSIDYYISAHEREDILFPWGWARTVNKFYDLLSSLGSKDRRWLERITQNGGLRTYLVRNQACSIEIISNTSLSHNAIFGFSDQESDSMLYVTSGVAEIRIDGISGKFKRGEFIFIPKVVSYVVEVDFDSSVAKLLI